MADTRTDAEIEDDREVDEALRRTEETIAGLESVQYPDHREHRRLLALEKARGRAGEFASTKAITYLARRVRTLREAVEPLKQTDVQAALPRIIERLQTADGESWAVGDALRRLATLIKKEEED